jgi:hypothetical protein
MLRILAGFVFAAILTGSAAAADYRVGAPPPPARGHGYAALPECDAPGVLARISEKFAHQDARITRAGLAITGIDGIRQRALKASGPSLTDRRYCGGTSWLSNGRSSEVVYLIEAPKLGTFSIGWNVESCLPGFDPYRVYDAHCRSIRP